jgi:MOSC domain-containing protein YiiM
LFLSKGGVPKLPIDEAQISELGIAGDVQRDRRYHGGPERALCLYSREVIEFLNREGHPIAPGSTGENILIENLDWNLVVPGVRLQLGDVTVQITNYTTPCFKIKDSFLNGEFSRVHHKKHLGLSRVYARVLQTGTLKIGDAVELLETNK